MQRSSATAGYDENTVLPQAKVSIGENRIGSRESCIRQNYLGPMQVENANALITAVLGRVPEWVRQDFASRDAAARSRAEETLAAMVSVALQVGSDRTA